jgi:hypothetical protein
MQENDSKSTGISEIIFVRENVQKIKTISSCTHLPGHFPTSWKPPRVVLGSCTHQECAEWFWAHAHTKSAPSGFGLMHTPRVRGIHCLGHLTGSSRTPVVHTQPLCLFLSLHQCNLLPLSDKREGRVLSSFTTFDFPFSSEKEHFLSSSTSSHHGFYEPQTLGNSSLSRPYITPTTNHRK